MKTEPAVIISTISAFVTALISLLVAFNIDVTPEQQEAILKTIAAIVPMILLTGAIIRGYVFAPKTVEEKFPPPGNEVDPMDESTWLSPPAPGR